MTEFLESMGALATNVEGCTEERFYITTAISYTNGEPHIGHAYEFMSADVITRFARVLGYNTYFVTGSDEHGQKVAAAAAKANTTPLDHCNYYVDRFKEVHKRYKVSYSHFVRTTADYHLYTAQKLWKMCASAGDIYLSAYEGWYNEREEVFVSETEAEAQGFIDPGNGLPLKRVKEESYFFRMSAYEEKLLSYIECNPSFIQPEQYRNSLLARLKAEGLKDLSVSRTSFDWGVRVPEGFDEKHVMYVWFDALSNYLTGVHALDSEHELSQFWPAAMHIIGKDIVWFHGIIWPTILMSAGLPLPETVYCHGFVNAADGRKMSKSYGNSIDPFQILDKYPIDSVRYYTIASITYGSDLNFSEESLITMHNSELADIVGNLVHRALNLCNKYCGGEIPCVSHDGSFEMPFSVDKLVEEVTADVKNCNLNLALFKGMEAARSTNGYLSASEPWKMKGENENRRPSIVRTALEAIYIFMHILAPIVPVAAEEVFRRLGTRPRRLALLRNDFYNLSPGTKITIGDVLFKKMDSFQDSSLHAEPSHPIVSEDHQLDLTKLDLRVGVITKIWKHETSETLFCEEVDVGEESPRQIASGLRGFYLEDDLLNSKVVVVCNLKESKFRGFLSCGMVLAAKSETGAVEIIEADSEAVPGDRVFLSGHELVQPLSSAIIKKQKIWEKVSIDLRTDSSRALCWQHFPLINKRTGKNLTSKSLANVAVS